MALSGSGSAARFPDHPGVTPDPGHRWLRPPDGRQLAALRIVSPEALALRAALRVDRPPDGAALRSFGGDPKDTRTISGAEIDTSLERDRAAVETAPVYRSPAVLGASLTLGISRPQ